MNKVCYTLTDEKFADIYTDEKFRRQVAYAHGYCNAQGQLLGRKTCSYPVEYIVTESQIAEAKAELARAKDRTIAENVGKLLLTGMGMPYKAAYNDDVCNHRVRAEFIAPDGTKYFFECSKGRGDNMHVSDAINRTIEEREIARCGGSAWTNQSKYYIDTRGIGDSRQYTLTNILTVVNHLFKCNFKEAVVDNYNISCEDVVSVSPAFD